MLCLFFDTKNKMLWLHATLLYTQAYTNNEKLITGLLDINRAAGK